MDSSLLTLSGFLLTFVIDFINKNIANSETRRAISYVFCVFWGSLINVIEHNGIYTGLTLSQIVTSFLITIAAVFGFSQITYRGIPGTDINWENSDLRSDLGMNAKTK